MLAKQLFVVHLHQLFALLLFYVYVFRCLLSFRICYCFSPFFLFRKPIIHISVYFFLSLIPEKMNAIDKRSLYIHLYLYTANRWQNVIDCGSILLVVGQY